jgi:hypothetical protein
MSLDHTQLAKLEQKPPTVNNTRPCFALAFESLKDHPELCDMIMARAENYHTLNGFYQQCNNGRSAYIDGLQQSVDLLITIVQAVYDTKGNMRFSDEYLDKLNQSFCSVIETAYLMLEMSMYSQKDSKDVA